MCGIAGSYGLDKPSDIAVSATLSLMYNRGPDSNGYYCSRLNDKSLSLLHTRLSIIDCNDRAKQPMEKSGCVLVFNGEIYNYLEIRSELNKYGYVFNTESDTEVLLNAYLEWGIECVHKLEGMWAFAIADSRNGSLYLCRDRFGEKPLFYTAINSTLYFASQARYIASLSNTRLSLNLSQVQRYLVNGYRSLYKTKETFYENVFEVPAASTIYIDAKLNIEEDRYWLLKYTPVPISIREAEKEIKGLLSKSLNIRLRSDVPIAFCLSGGIDSSVLAALSVSELNQDIHTFSIIDRDERYNELENIELTIDYLQCKHHLIKTEESGFIERMKVLVKHHDAPVPTISYYVHNLLSESIKKMGYSVAISGTGADEVFTGYYDHYSFWLAYMSGRKDFYLVLEEWRQSYGKFVNNPLLKDPFTFVKDPARRDHLYQNQEIFELFLTNKVNESFEEYNYTDNLLHNRMMNELFHEVVPVILRADDSNSMMWSIENRSPYLDKSLVEFMYTVPNENLIVNGYVKWLLRSVGKEILPDQVIYDKRKRGFNASIDSLLDRTNPDTREFILQDSPIYEIVNKIKINELIDNDLTDNSFSKFMFSFISAKLFLETALDAQSIIH